MARMDSFEKKKKISLMFHMKENYTICICLVSHIKLQNKLLIRYKLDVIPSLNFYVSRNVFNNNVNIGNKTT